MSTIENHGKNYGASALLAMTLLAANAAQAGTATVGASGADYTTVAAAMADQATWCGTPSNTNTCSLKLAAGQHTVPDGNFTLPDYMSMSGEGNRATIISANASDRVLVTGSHSNVSNLGIDLGTNTRSLKVGITVAGDRVHVENVRVTASGLTTFGNVSGYTTGAGLASTIINPEVELALSGNGFASGLDIGNGNHDVENARVRISGAGYNYGIRSYGANTVRGADIQLSGASVDGHGFSAISNFATDGSRHGTYSDIRAQVLTAPGSRDALAFRVTTGRTGNIQLNNLWGAADGASNSVGFFSDGQYVRLLLANSAFMAPGASIRITAASDPNAVLKTQISRSNAIWGPIQISTPNALCSALTDENGVYFANSCPNQ